MSRRGEDPASGSRRRLFGIIQSARPRQWTKNVLVFAAPGAAGVLFHAKPFGQSVVAFAAFCLTASGGYMINDARDVIVDRQHPTKRLRPVAAGILQPTSAMQIGVVLVVAGGATCFLVGWQLAVVVASYASLSVVYSTILKYINVVDIVAIAVGLVLRSLAGAAATGVPISNWFFIVASFGSLLMVSGKRHGEAFELGPNAVLVRSTLANYSMSYLSYLRSVSSGAALVAYCLWAFDKARGTHTSIPWYEFSILPFVLGVLRYAYLIDQGRGAAPEELVFEDRTLRVIGIAWALIFALGVYKL